MNKSAKIVMITMFKNESRVLQRMLESCKPHVDFYVMQNNGSTDGSDEIAKQFLLDNKLSGVVYEVEEGWKGFGWNRDHLIQYCQRTDHGCDWILKMDCDEVLEIDESFDWSILDSKETQAFHIPAVSGDCVYYRAWMYNAKLPWRFNHDPCHETVYCDIPEIGNQFACVDLPVSFRQIGYNEGQSWSNPTKFISDALILEEKMIRENSILDNLYHFWYIGKSYFDAYQSHSFPLGDSQKKEFAKRCIYYFNEYINHVQKQRGGQFVVDEMCYNSLLFSAECHSFLGDQTASIACYNLAGNFAPGRNDHYFALAQIYKKSQEYEKMLEVTTIMMQPERTNAFPRYSSFIDQSIYYDSKSNKVQDLHSFALNKVSNHSEKFLEVFNINKLPQKRFFVVDNFYINPENVREFALSVEYKEDIRWYKGLRSEIPYRPKGIKQAFERIIGEEIFNFEEHGYNGCFQITTASDPQVYHYDMQKWAAMIYLTPDAPLESGTRLHKSKITGLRHASEEGVDFSFSCGFYDSTKFDVVDSAGNIFNRLVIMDARSIHSAGPYFGQSNGDGRLTHLFFFD